LRLGPAALSGLVVDGKEESSFLKKEAKNF
jgi:hypothetical protein